METTAHTLALLIEADLLGKDHYSSKDLIITAIGLLCRGSYRHQWYLISPLEGVGDILVNKKKNLGPVPIGRCKDNSGELYRTMGSHS